MEIHLCQECHKKKEKSEQIISFYRCRYALPLVELNSLRIISTTRRCKTQQPHAERRNRACKSLCFAVALSCFSLFGFGVQRKRGSNVICHFKWTVTPKKQCKCCFKSYLFIILKKKSLSTIIVCYVEVEEIFKTRAFKDTSWSLCTAVPLICCTISDTFYD